MDKRENKNLKIEEFEEELEDLDIDEEGFEEEI
jgi:hypothetical protein